MGCFAIRLARICLAVLLPIVAGAARAEPVLNLDRLPLGAEGRADYGRFLLQATPRAFAVGESGAWGWAAGFETPADAAARALALCASWGRPCRVHAVDLAVVDAGEPPAAPLPTAPLAVAEHWVLHPDGRFLQHGPVAARGAYLWAHGRARGGADSRGDQPQPHVRAFNNAGWDVLRLDRDPTTDTTEAGAAAMREAVRDLREAGYRRVVAGGQSRGAWNALQALAEPGLVDGVVAIAPAAHGPRGSPAHAYALDDLAAVVAGASSADARVAVVVFADDEYDPDPDGRAAILAELAPRVGGLWLLDRPVGIVGHGGGMAFEFTTRYAPCLLSFVEGGPPDCGAAAALQASASTPAAATANPPP